VEWVNKGKPEDPSATEATDPSEMCRRRSGLHGEVVVDVDVQQVPVPWHAA
jgi:hypothetical protein